MNFFQFAQSSKSNEPVNPFEKMLGTPMQTMKINPPLFQMPEISKVSNEDTPQNQPTSNNTPSVPDNYNNDIENTSPASISQQKPFQSSFPNIMKSPSKIGTNPITTENMDEKMDELEDYYRRIEIWGQEESKKANDLIQQMREYSIHLDQLYEEMKKNLP